jgi:hypothetical protein
LIASGGQKSGCDARVTEIDASTVGNDRQVITEAVQVVCAKQMQPKVSYDSDVA